MGNVPEERKRMGGAKIVTTLRTRRTDSSRQGYDTAVKMYIYFTMAMKGREEGTGSVGMAVLVRILSASEGLPVCHRLRLDRVRRGGRRASVRYCCLDVVWT